MLIGTVTWTFKNGQKKDGGFAARALIEGADSEKPRLKLYQGWAVSAPQAVVCLKSC